MTQPTSKKICGFPECGREVNSRGFCQPHARQDRLGKPMRPVKFQLPRGATEEQKLDHYTEKTDYCWNWTGGLNQNGHGILKTTRNGIRTSVGPHRIAYIREFGPIPEGLCLDHKCRNPKCVRPSHLHAVTNKQNMENLRGARSDSRTGVRGVTRRSNGKFAVHVGHHGKIYHKGTYVNIEEARQAAIELRNTMHVNNRLDWSTNA